MERLEPTSPADTPLVATMNRLGQAPDRAATGRCPGRNQFVTLGVEPVVPVTHLINTTETEMATRIPAHAGR